MLACLIIRIGGFGAHYTIVIRRNPQNSIGNYYKACRSAFYTIEVLGEASCSFLEDVAELKMWQVEASSEPEPSSPVSSASVALYPKRMPRLSGTVLQVSTFGLVSWVGQTGQAPDLRVPLRAGFGV